MMLIFRPFTPPELFAWPIAALQPASAFWNVDDANPVFEKTNPAVMVLAVTPWSGPAVAAPPVPDSTDMVAAVNATTATTMLVLMTPFTALPPIASVLSLILGRLPRWRGAVSTSTGE